MLNVFSDKANNQRVIINHEDFDIWTKNRLTFFLLVAIQFSFLRNHLYGVKVQIIKNKSQMQRCKAFRCEQNINYLKFLNNTL